MVNQDSVLHVNDVFVNKLQSRRSLSSDEQFSPPRNSESYNCKLPGRVPFKWELKPGIPIDSPNEEGDSSSIPLDSSLRLKKNPSLKSNNHPQNQIIEKGATFTGPDKASWYFKRPKKALKKSGMMFSHSKSCNSDHYYFSSSSTGTSKSSSSTSAATESPNCPKALVPSSPMPSRSLRTLAKRLLQRVAKSVIVGEVLLGYQPHPHRSRHLCVVCEHRSPHVRHRYRKRQCREPQKKTNTEEVTMGTGSLHKKAELVSAYTHGVSSGSEHLGPQMILQHDFRKGIQSMVGKVGGKSRVIQHGVKLCGLLLNPQATAEYMAAGMGVAIMF